jgi:hypothetical protein
MLGQAVEDDAAQPGWSQRRPQLPALRVGEKMPGNGRSRQEMTAAARRPTASNGLSAALPAPTLAERSGEDRPSQGLSLTIGHGEVDSGLPDGAATAPGPEWQLRRELTAEHADGRSLQPGSAPGSSTAATESVPNLDSQAGTPLAGADPSGDAQPGVRFRSAVANRDFTPAPTIPRRPAGAKALQYAGEASEPLGERLSRSVTASKSAAATQAAPDTDAYTAQTESGQSPKERSSRPPVNGGLAPAAVTSRPSMGLPLQTADATPLREAPRTAHSVIAPPEAAAPDVQAPPTAAPPPSLPELLSAVSQTGLSIGELPASVPAAVASTPIEIADSSWPAEPPSANPERPSSRGKAGPAVLDPVRASDVATPELAFANRLMRIAASADRAEDRPAPPAPADRDRAKEATPPELAFSARLVRTSAAEASRAAETVPDPPIVPSPTAQTNREPGLPPTAAERPVAQTSARKAAATADAAGATAGDHPLQSDLSSRFAPAAEPDVQRDRQDVATPAGTGTRPAQLVEEPPEAARPAPMAHEIKLQLSGGDQRVEVRMVERGGEVHVDVRTPDARLAGALREDLPALSARLEQSGFHAESWHTGLNASPDRQPMPQTTAGAPSQDQQNRSGQDRNNQQDGRQPPPKNQNNPQPKDDRKDFAWLFTSLR